MGKGLTRVVGCSSDARFGRHGIPLTSGIQGHANPTGPKSRGFHRANHRFLRNLTMILDERTSRRGDGVHFGPNQSRPCMSWSILQYTPCHCILQSKNEIWVIRIPQTLTVRSAQFQTTYLIQLPKNSSAYHGAFALPWVWKGFKTGLVDSRPSCFR